MAAQLLFQNFSLVERAAFGLVIQTDCGNLDLKKKSGRVQEGQEEASKACLCQQQLY